MLWVLSLVSLLLLVLLQLGLWRSPGNLPGLLASQFRPGPRHIQCSASLAGGDPQQAYAAQIRHDLEPPLAEVSECYLSVIRATRDQSHAGINTNRAIPAHFATLSDALNLQTGPVQPTWQQSCATERNILCKHWFCGKIQWPGSPRLPSIAVRCLWQAKLSPALRRRNHAGTAWAGGTIPPVCATGTADKDRFRDKAGCRRFA
jgi:hypothetical protein